MDYICHQQAMKNLDIKMASEKVYDYLKKQNLSSSMITIHNALLVAACESLKKRKIKVNLLEIGTYDGINANILAAVSKPISITTYDLSPTDGRILAHNPLANEINELKSLYLKRINMTSDNSIHYIEQPSSRILINSTKNTFNLVWVDGDHSFPQVAFDIMSGLFFVGQNKYSIMFCDDVFESEDNSTWQCLRNIEKDTDYRIMLFQKRHCGNKCVALIYKVYPYSVENKFWV